MILFLSNKKSSILNTGFRTFAQSSLSVGYSIYLLPTVSVLLFFAFSVVSTCGKVFSFQLSDIVGMQAVSFLCTSVHADLCIVIDLV